MAWKYVQYDAGKYRTTDQGGGGGNVDDVEVNGVSVVNAEQVAEIVSYKEVTQAQYNALPATKTSDGVMYCITDVAGDADSFPPLIYSDEERQVGVWRDGKPLYQKTINFGALPDAAEKFVAHNITNLDEITRLYGITSNSTGGTFPLPFVNIEVSTGYQILLRATASDIVVRTGSDRTAFTNTFITLQYTKTTDTPGSGTWTTQGGFAQHYSETEHVVGTWIDGKPLYEKTVDCGYLYNNGTKGIAHNISNIKRIIGHSGGAINSSGTYLPLPKVAPTGLQYCVDIAATTTDIFITTGNDRTDYYAYVTLRYTKTTD